MISLELYNIEDNEYYVMLYNLYNLFQGNKVECITKPELLMTNKVLDEITFRFKFNGNKVVAVLHNVFKLLEQLNQYKTIEDVINNISSRNMFYLTIFGCINFDLVCDYRSNISYEFGFLYCLMETEKYKGYKLITIDEFFNYNCFLGANQGQLIIPNSYKDIINKDIYVLKDELSD